MRLLSLCILTTVFGLASCKTTSSNQSAELMSSPGSSTFLSDAGERAKSFFYQRIEQRNEIAKQNKVAVRFNILDARDPRLYAPGAAIQPPTPADKVLIKYNESNAFQVLAFIIDRPGEFVLKEAPTGNLVISIGFRVERIEYSSRFDGLYASTHRVTSGEGWQYIYYVRGFGNEVTPAFFDEAVATFLTNAALYVTPVMPNEVPPKVFGTQKP